MDKESQAESLMALANYALNGEEQSLPPEARMFFTLTKPQIDANQKKFENGRRGGRPKKPINNQTKTKEKPNNNQTETKPEPNVNDNDNVNVNDNIIKKEKEKEKIDFGNMKNAMTVWLGYKKERGQTYKPIGLKKCLANLRKLSNDDDFTACKIVDRSIANNWSGLFALDNKKRKNEFCDENGVPY